VIFGISPDSVVSHQKFIQKNNLTITLLSDEKHAVIEAYGAWGKKNMYGKEFEGVVRSTVLADPKGVVRAVWPKASSEGHAAEVLAVLQKLAA
jgi:peroxiredoxin Q/BCP